MICLNQSCKRIVSPYDETCGHCGTPLKAHPAKDYIKKADQVVSEGLITIDYARNYAKKIGGLSSLGKAEFLGKDKGEPGVSVLNDLNTLENITETGKRGSMVQEIFGLVANNPHVTENQAFRKKAGRTLAIYDHEEAKVNAFAAFDADNEINLIVIFEGYLNFMLAVEAIFKTRIFDKLIPLGERLQTNKYKFSLYDLGAVIDDLPDGAKYFEKPFISCYETMAHELGHICYDHIFSPGYSNMSLDESRNMERDADSFAASIINRSLFKKEIFDSHLKCCLAWAVVEKVGGRVEPSTHPLAYERLLNAIKNNSALAKKMGVDEALIIKLFG